MENIVIKIDIEGYEAKLIEDILNHIYQLNDYTIIFEYHSITTGDEGIKKINEMMKFLLKNHKVNIYIMYNNNSPFEKVINLDDLDKFRNNEIVISTLKLD